MPIERLAAGQTFHKTVQSAFLTGLVGASGFKERRWRLIAGGRGRVDLAVEVDDSEQMLVIIEIKGTDWDKIPAARLMANLRRHLRQLQTYLDTAIEDMEAGQWTGVARSPCKSSWQLPARNLLGTGRKRIHAPSNGLAPHGLTWNSPFIRSAGRATGRARLTVSRIAGP